MTGALPQQRMRLRLAVLLLVACAALGGVVVRGWALRAARYTRDLHAAIGLAQAELELQRTRPQLGRTAAPCEIAASGLIGAEGFSCQVSAFPCQFVADQLLCAVSGVQLPDAYQLLVEVSAADARAALQAIVAR